MEEIIMRFVKIILILSVIFLAITSCVSSEINTHEDETTVVETEKTIPQQWKNRLEEARVRRTGRTIEDDLESLIKWNEAFVIGVAVQFVPERELDRTPAIGEYYGERYVFRITENFSSFDFPEYINVSSQQGEVFVIGEEYVFSPRYSRNSIRDVSIITDLHQVIPTRMLSDDDMVRVREHIANQAANRSDTGQGDGGNRITSRFAEYAVLEQEYLDIVHLALKLTVTEEEPHSNVHLESVYSIKFHLDDILWVNPEIDESDIDHLFYQDWLTVNEPVEVGGTYIVMLNVLNRSWLPAARNGAIVSADSEMGMAFMEAFAEM